MILRNAPKIYIGASEELHKIIINLYNMAQLSKREGLLALDDLKSEEIKSFGRQMLEFILEAVENKNLTELAQGFIAQSLLGNEDLLCLMVVAEGLLQIQEGESGERLMKKLIFKLGYKNQKVIYNEGY